MKVRPVLRANVREADTLRRRHQRTVRIADLWIVHDELTVLATTDGAGFDTHDDRRADRRPCFLRENDERAAGDLDDLVAPDRRIHQNAPTTIALAERPSKDGWIDQALWLRERGQRNHVANPTAAIAPAVT